MTTKPTRTRLPPDDRRAQLVRHAVACFADHGIARATQAHVARRAGVSVSAVYSYFRSRDDLLDVVLETVEADLIAMVGDAVAGEAPPGEALRRLAMRTADTAREEPETVRVWLDWSTGVRADVWPRYLAMQDRLHAIVRGVLIRGLPGAAVEDDPRIRSATRLFVGGAHTLALMQFADTSASELETVIDQMVLAALGARPGERAGAA